MDLQYDILFSVELLHKFFTDQLCRDFTIAPSQLTAQTLSGHRMIIKACQNELYAAIQSNSGGTPFIAPEEGTQMTFFLTLKNSLFFNYTNLPSAWPSGKLYYFTNRNNNGSDGKNFLTANTPFDNTRTYAAGDLALNATGTVFEAIGTSTGNPPPADNVSSSLWRQIDPVTARNRYLSETDALQWLPSRSTYSFTTPQGSSVTQDWAYEKATGDYTLSVISQTVNYPTPVPSFTLDLSTLPPGKYKLTVNGTTQNIYINDELTGANALAVIEIFQDSSLAPAYRMLSAGGTLLSPVYSVYFLNRSTIWKYVSAGSAIAGLTDNANVYQFIIPNPNVNTVFSATPIPLSEAALSLSLKIGTQNYSPVECASPQRLVTTAQPGGTYPCSEIFLNY
jgi:hypothetical protein